MQKGIKDELIKAVADAIENAWSAEDGNYSHLAIAAIKAVNEFQKKNHTIIVVPMGNIPR